MASRVVIDAEALARYLGRAARSARLINIAPIGSGRGGGNRTNNSGSRQIVQPRKPFPVYVDEASRRMGL